MTILSGPMFEGAVQKHWCSDFHKDGAHYNIFAARGDLEMAALREFFPNGEADEDNFCLFSTSGIHGTYATIEDIEDEMSRGNRSEDGEPITPEVTFLIVQPRIVCLRYGNCHPKDESDIQFLKKLRESSWRAVHKIGKADSQ